MKNEGVIALGSNIEPEEHIPVAIHNLAENFQLKERSEFIYTKPLGYTSQPDFLNGAVLIRTHAGKEDIIATLKMIEQKMGRQRNGRKNGPRKIDLDLVLFKGRIIDEDVFERDFLMKSVQEVLPDFKFPQYH